MKWFRKRPKKLSEKVRDYESEMIRSRGNRPLDSIEITDMQGGVLMSGSPFPFVSQGIHRFGREDFDEVSVPTDPDKGVRWISRPSDEALAKAWWEGVNAQWKHRPTGNRILEAENPYS